MLSAEDRARFVSNVVGQSMASGKFPIEDILTLTEAAFNAHTAIFGRPADAPPLGASAHAPAAPQMVAIPQPSLPEGKPFEMWKNDKCMHWNAGVRESTWEWLCEQAKAGSLQAKTTLKDLANSDPGDPSAKYYKSNVRRAERAKAVLLMVV